MIDPTAVVSPHAKLGENVRIDPYAVVESDVEIGDDCWLGNHSVVRSHTKIGHSNRIHEFAVLGGEPQSIHYRGEPTRLEIGDRNSIREMVTLNRGTEPGAVTRIGSDNIIMAYTHIAHDCQIGDHCIFANGTNLAGKVSVGDHAFTGGFTLVHQNCRLGAHCMTGINTVLRQDVPPFMMVNGNPAHTKSVNVRGIRRRGFDSATISALKRVFELYFLQNMSLNELLASLEEEVKQHHNVQQFIEFLQSSERGVVR